MASSTFSVLENSDSSDKDSQTSQSSQSSTASTNSRKIKGGKDYELSHTYPSKDEPEKIIESELVWSKRGTSKNTNHGTKQFYRCNLVAQRAKEQCEAFGRTTNLSLLNRSLLFHHSLFH